MRVWVNPTAEKGSARQRTHQTRLGALRGESSAYTGWEGPIALRPAPMGFDTIHVSILVSLSRLSQAGVIPFQ